MISNVNNLLEKLNFAEKVISLSDSEIEKEVSDMITRQGLEPKESAINHYKTQMESRPKEFNDMLSTFESNLADTININETITK